MNGELRVTRRPSKPSFSAVGATLLTVVAFGLVAAGCQEHDFEPPSREERVAEADSFYSSALFDSITWPSDSARALEGDVVYATECRKCHGTFGRGGTEYAAERDLVVPTLVAPDWEFGDDVETVRHRIFVGHPAGMPSWGVALIEPREIDAAAFYLVERLRPEILGDSAGTDGGG